MSAFEKVKDWVSKDRQVYPDRPIDPAHVEPAFNATAVKAGRDYFRLWMVQMFLKKETLVGRDWYPAVHSCVRLQFGEKTVEVANVADPMKALQMDEQPSGDIIFRRKALTPLMPFNGGTVEVGAGLVALRGSKDFLGQFLNVVGEFAGLLAVPQLSVALDIAVPVINGVQGLFSAGQAGLHLGWFDTFVGEGGQVANVLKAGYISIARTPQSQLSADQLWVSNDLLYKGTGLPPAKSKVLEGLDHMLFRIEVRSDRDDLNQLTRIYGPFNKALDALNQRSFRVADTYYGEAISAARTSPDLTLADRGRLQEEMKTTYTLEKESAKASGAVSAKRPTLQDMMKQARSPDAALDAGAPLLDDLLDV